MVFRVGLSHENSQKATKATEPALFATAGVTGEAEDAEAKSLPKKQHKAFTNRQNTALRQCSDHFEAIGMSGLIRPLRDRETMRQPDQSGDLNNLFLICSVFVDSAKSWLGECWTLDCHIAYLAKCLSLDFRSALSLRWGLKQIDTCGQASVSKHANGIYPRRLLYSEGTHNITLLFCKCAEYS